MGRLIDSSSINNCVMMHKSDWGIFATNIDNIIGSIVMECSTVEAIPKADYESRLKADMVAMLEELKEQLREMHEDFFETEHFDEAYGVSDSMDVIQQKIDALKEDK